MLGLPYLLLVGSVGGALWLGIRTIEDASHSIWIFSSVSWVIPYTVLAIYLLRWSRRKTLEQIRARYTSAPVMMMIMSAYFYIALAIAGFLLTPALREWGILLAYLSVAAVVISIPASLFLGFMFVGFSRLFYVMLRWAHLIRD